MKNENYMNVFGRKIITMIFLFIILCSLSSQSIYATMMYDNDIKNDSAKKGIGETKSDSKLDEKIVRPTAPYDSNKGVEKKVDKNAISKYPEKEKEIKIIMPYEELPKDEATQYYDKNNKFTYIRHRYGISEVSGNYEWQEVKCDNNDIEWMLLIHINGDEELGPPFYATSGFYKVDGDIYCFDKEGHLILGYAKDEQDIIYEFDDQGRLINKYKE